MKNLIHIFNILLQKHKFIYPFYAFLLFFLISTTSFAQTTTIDLSLSTTPDITTIQKGTGDYILTTNGKAITNKRVVVQSGYSGTITLQNLDLTSNVAKSSAIKYGASGYSCITIEGDPTKTNKEPVTKVDLILSGTNKLTYNVSSFGTALQVNQAAQIHINSIDPTDDSKGTLKVGPPDQKSGSGVGGIGAPFYPVITSSNISGSTALSTGTIIGTCNNNHSYTAGGNIIIGSGTIEASASLHAAAIGGGWHTYYDGIILIYGGNVIANGPPHGAGIGSGCPTQEGVVPCYASNSTIVALPPSNVTAVGGSASGSSGDTQSWNTVNSQGGLNGAGNLTYLNDPGKPEIAISTEDNHVNAAIYIDMSESEENKEIAALFEQLLGVGVGPDLKKVKLGVTGSDGKFRFNGEFQDIVTIFTDASQDGTGRPYMPKEFKSPGNNQAATVVLDLFEGDISLTDSVSTPLTLGYTPADASKNAYRIKVIYGDETSMTGITFNYSSTDFQNAIYYKGTDETAAPLPAAPTTLSKGDVYTIVVPIKEGKAMAIYNNVLTINGVWKDIALPGPIRKVITQKVVKDDTGVNQYIKLTASKNTFVDTAFPNITSTDDLTLKISHTGTGVSYDKADVTAKYLISKKAKYEDAVKETPLAKWQTLNIPQSDAEAASGKLTTVSFNGSTEGLYYIHWYVMSGVVFAHSQDFTTPILQNGAFGPYILTTPLTAGTIAGNPYTCNDALPQEIKGGTSTGGSGTYSYQWEISQDNSTWTTITGATTINYQPVKLTQSPTYYRKKITDTYGLTAISNVFSITNAPDVVLYWKGTKDRNWNDPANWEGTVNGTKINMVPVACNDVILASGVTNYPSLAPEDTPTDIYGLPTVEDVLFEYGAQLAYQHKLIYRRATIQYNLGYYGNLTSTSYGAQPTQSLTNTVMNRDKWFALSAPLKSMASGDFGFNGYPVTWQSGFALANPEGNTQASSIVVGTFDKTFSKNDMPLAETNNAIALKVPLYADKTGSKDQKNLEKLKGIITIPYLDSSKRELDEHGHTYDPYSLESKFYYYNAQTLQQIYSPVGTMRRGDESYRFIYEDENNQAETIIVSGNQVPGYRQKVQRASTETQVMLGNPFMSKLNSKNFFDANSTKLDEAQGFAIFESQTGTWKQSSFASTNYIPAFQAFIVHTNDVTVDLLYPLEGDLSLTRSVSQRSTEDASSILGLSMKVVNNEGIGGDPSNLELVNNGSSTINRKKMIHPEGHITPETFFIGTDVADYNLIQNCSSDLKEIAFAIKTSDTQSSMALSFDNVETFTNTHNVYPILVDTYKQTKQNLKLNNTYYFTQRSLSADDFYIDSDRFSLQLLSLNDDSLSDEGLDISIVYTDAHQLEIKTTGKEINSVEIFDLKGRICYKKDNIASDSFTKQLQLNVGAYVVKVSTKVGSKKSEKIFVK